MNQIDILDQLEKDLKYMSAGPIRRRALLASLPIVLASCASVPKTRYREGDNSNQKTELTVKDEIQMTKEYLPKMQKDYPKLQDKFMQNYIQKLGQKIVKANGLNKNPYSYNFTVVKSKAVNAFALPAGEVFVTTPLIAIAESEAELAGVIGHEIGHIQARHTAERLDKAKEEQSKTWMYGLGGLIAGGAIGYGLAKALCSKKDKECLERITKYGAMAGGAGGLLIQKYGFMANSREDEMEADRIGFKTSLLAGYHKNYIGKFYEKLLKMEKQHKKANNKLLASLADAMSTHPPSKERVNQMKEMARKAKNKKGKISSKDFNKAKSIATKIS